jgi:hypothetical protein
LQRDLVFGSWRGHKHARRKARPRDSLKPGPGAKALKKPLFYQSSMGLGLLSMAICFDFRSTNIVHLSNRKPYFYRFQCHHPLITQLTFNLITVGDLYLSIFFFAFPFIFVHWAMIINFCFNSYTNFKGWNYKIGCFGPCNTRGLMQEKLDKKTLFFVCHMAAAALRFCMRKLMTPKDWDNKTYHHSNHNKYLTVGNMYITSI